MRFRLKKMRVFSLAVLSLVSSAAFSQQKIISGLVTDELSGEPLPGVTIVIEGTTQGTVSGYDGAYSLTASQGQTLVFSYIGYEQQKVRVDDQLTLHIQMK
ncbi:MAG TPA: carboxypeptidase-like regulatory domain-containing protein, partial [Prolixibacteraceae bacterium]|nr:carboxypeptidase-like regulatory domain-containing protein [Prolixibacteraceae bacterium]